MFRYRKSMRLVTDLSSYFHVKELETKTTVSKKKFKLTNQEIIVTSSKTGDNPELEFVKDEVEKFVRAEHYSNIPEHLGEEAVRYVLLIGTKAAMQKFSKLHPKFLLKRLSINSWKAKVRKHSNTTNLIRKNYPIY